MGYYGYYLHFWLVTYIVAGVIVGWYWRKYQRQCEEWAEEREREQRALDALFENMKEQLHEVEAGEVTTKTVGGIPITMTKLNLKTTDTSNWPTYIIFDGDGHWHHVKARSPDEALEILEVRASATGGIASIRLADPEKGQLPC